MTKTTTSSRITAADVHGVLGRHMLADGFDMVLDIDKSRGRRLWDAKRGRAYLDLFSFFATVPVGLNHPKMLEPEFLAKLQRAALVNPTNSDIYTVEMAEFVDAFARLAMPEYLPHLFLVAGGTLGIENALKAAFDWKVRRNFRKGYTQEKGHQVLHFREAFHGRSGYTLSLTNTADPRKYQYFPKFDWPRVDVPKLRFPVTEDELDRVQKAEAESLRQIKHAFAERKDDIAAIIIEPIQGEGGDNHLRAEFLRALRQVADENEAMLVFDEVQAGLGLTGRMWSHQHFDVKPDFIGFGKKTQVCGMMAGSRIDDETDNVFHLSSRLNSTWGGNLVDMVRCQRYLEIMDEEQLVERAAKTGAVLLRGLQGLEQEFPDFLGNARGRGLMCAIDARNGEMRDAIANRVFAEGAVLLGSGVQSLRFRPPLDITEAEVAEGLDIIRRCVKAVGTKAA